MDNLFFLMVVAPHFDGIFNDKNCMETTTWSEAGVAMTITFTNERSYYSQFVEFVENYDIQRAIKEYQDVFTVDQLIHILTMYHQKLKNILAELDCFFYKGRVISANTKVFVYYNLHKHLFSVKALEGEYEGKVVLHLPLLYMREAEFVVNEKGRIRVLRERKKYVHAGVRGYLDTGLNVRDYSEAVAYNPYKTKTFVCVSTNEAIFKVKNVMLKDKCVWTTNIIKKMIGHQQLAL
ncbi:hypothetical protein ACMGD3_24355 [Lysinibacillus sphaericus]|uniref:hypothetical protein n=1 Tax=Lysinibacillus sphaericus TaxID=1421 RepID=UPI003F7941B6